MSEDMPPNPTVTWVRAFAGTFALGLMLASLGAVSTYRSQHIAMEATVQGAKVLMKSIEADRDQALADADAAATKITAAEAITKRWQARVSLFRAEEHILAHNFGLAERLLRGSARLLQEACIEAPCDWKPLQKTLEEHRFALSDDNEISLKEVRDFGLTLDGHLAP